MRERKILIVVILVVTVFAVSVAPPVQRWWKKDAGVTATAGVKDENISVPTKVTFDYANFDAEIRNHKSMTITLDHYGTIHKDRNYELGTVENPFIILEVVPFEGYAEFGYLIPGCEPISFDRANVKYVNSIQDANNIAIQFNTMVTGNPVRVEEGIGYAEYYSRPSMSGAAGIMILRFWKGCRLIMWRICGRRTSKNRRQIRLSSAGNCPTGTIFMRTVKGGTDVLSGYGIIPGIIIWIGREGLPYRM